MAQTAIWIPPCLDGTQLRITADWTDGSIVDGVSYRHPIPHTITDIQIISVSDALQPMTLSMPDTSVFFADPPDDANAPIQAFLATKYPSATPAQKQVRGYLKYPIANPTPAECLYTYLWSYCGQTHTLPCGCSGHQFIDGRHPEAKATYVDHPIYSKKCDYHADDTIAMDAAKVDYAELAHAKGWDIIKPEDTKQ